MAVALQKWDMVTSGLFILLLQLIGINLAGAIIFRLFGLSNKGSRYKRGRKSIFYISMAATVVVLGLLLVWQFNNAPDYQRTTQSQKMEEEIQELIENVPSVGLVEANARFTRANIKGQNTLLCLVYVQKKEKSSQTDDELKRQLSSEIGKKLKSRYNVTPVVDITVLEPPEE